MIYILFHAKTVKPDRFTPCLDGLLAAFFAQKRHPRAVVIPAMYGTENAPDLTVGPGDRIYLLGLTYPSWLLHGWSDRGAEVIVLDHHETAMNDLSGLSQRITSTFDMSRSGAMLSWDYFFDGEASELVKYVQDRDLWLKSLPGCDLVNLALGEQVRLICQSAPIDEALPRLFALIQELIDQEDCIPALIKAGEEINVEVQDSITWAVLRARPRMVAGHCVPYVVLQGDREHQSYSDIGNVLASQPFKPGLFERPRLPLFAAIETRGGGLALRSVAFNVGTLAKTLGGGGHAKASGCRA